MYMTTHLSFERGVFSPFNSNTNHTLAYKDCPESFLSSVLPHETSMMTASLSILITLACASVAHSAVACQPLFYGRLAAYPLLANIPWDSNTSTTSDGLFIVGGGATDFTFEHCMYADLSCMPSSTLKRVNDRRERVYGIHTCSHRCKHHYLPRSC